MAPPRWISLHHRKSASIITIFIMFFFFSNNKLIYSSQSAMVEYLPGFPGKLPFPLETGYIGVGENEALQLFYYFTESQNNPEDDPLLLWVTGGPGCAGLWAMAFEFGPIIIDLENYNGSIPALILNEFSWTKMANIIFFDQPVGTGFSYGNTSEAYSSSDTTNAAHGYEFLKKWLIKHPKYLKNPVYIGGDSFSGITVPLIVDQIYNGIEPGDEPIINMKGYIVGNPTTDKNDSYNEKFPYAHRMGLLSDKLYESLKEACNGQYFNVDLENILCQNALESANKCLDKVRIYHILEPWCVSPENEDHMDYTNILESPTKSTNSLCRDYNYLLLRTWARDESVQKALHIREGTVSSWVRCNRTIQRSTHVYDVPKTTSYHRKFTNKRCRVLVYSGDHDMVIPYTGTERWVNSLNLPIRRDWSPWFVENQIAGYTMTYGQGAYELTYATLKGSGHNAPEYTPAQCFDMVRKWFDQIDL